MHNVFPNAFMQGDFSAPPSHPLVGSLRYRILDLMNEKKKKNGPQEIKVTWKEGPVSTAAEWAMYIYVRT